MFAEIKAAAWLQKLDYGDPAGVAGPAGAADGDDEGAKLLGIDASGRDAGGRQKADLILIDLQKPHLQPSTIPSP